MDKKSKILIMVFVVITLISVLFTYKRSFLDRNFIIIEEEVVVEEEAMEEIQ